MAPVKSGSRVRSRFTLKEARYRGADMIMLSYGVVVEIEGEPKPALTADWLTVGQFDPKDHPNRAETAKQSDSWPARTIVEPHRSLQRPPHRHNVVPYNA